MSPAGTRERTTTNAASADGLQTPAINTGVRGAERGATIKADGVLTYESTSRRTARMSHLTKLGRTNEYRLKPMRLQDDPEWQKGVNSARDSNRKSEPARSSEEGCAPCAGWTCPHCGYDDYVDIPTGRHCFRCEKPEGASIQQICNNAK